MEVLLSLWQYLDAGRSIADWTNMLTSSIDFINPCSRVQEPSFERFRAWDCRPSPILQSTRFIDEEIIVLFKSGPVCLTDLHAPLFSIFIPGSANNLTAASDILAQRSNMHEVRETIEDLFQSRVIS